MTPAVIILVIALLLPVVLALAAIGFWLYRLSKRLAPEEASRKAQPDRSKGLAVETERQGRLENLSAPGELHELLEWVHLGQLLNLRAGGCLLPLPRALAVYQNCVRAVSDHRVQQVGGVADARIEQGAELGVASQGVLWATTRGASKRARAAGEDLSSL